MVRYIAEDDIENEDFTVQQPPPAAYLALWVKGRVSQTFPLRGEITLGREKDNAIVVADEKVSRHHAVLTPMANTFIIQDQGSTNGTYVNGVQIAQPTRLHHNDRITLGDTEFIFTTTQPDPTAIDLPVPVNTIPSPQPVSPGPAPVVAGNNVPIWVAIGCMAAAIVALLVILALVFGMFLGQGNGPGSILLLWL